MTSLSSSVLEDLDDAKSICLSFNAGQFLGRKPPIHALMVLTVQEIGPLPRAVVLSDFDTNHFAIEFHARLQVVRAGIVLQRS